MTDSQLANDRTFLAWLRTGGVSDPALYSGVGVLVVLCGAALVLVGYAQHRSLAVLLAGDAGTPLPRWPRTITTGAIVGALLLSALIVVTT